MQSSLPPGNLKRTRGCWAFVGWAVCCLMLPFAGTVRARAYSVQTHEQLIDLTWSTSIVPLLRERYPNITDAQLVEAHAYAYGGCAIQDIGYYPFNKPSFSNLAHYARSGDFVAILLRDARTPDELAFAVGALSHYIGDTVGHSVAVNPSVAIEFPKLEHDYGRVVTYEDSPHDHIRTEFAFDINEISKQRFAPLNYLEHIGLSVSTDLLARAFYDTYGLKLNEVLKVQPTQIRGYRFAVRRLIPRIAYAETLLHRKSFPPDVEDADFLRLKAELAQSGLDNKWGPYRRHAGVGTHLLAGLIFVLPKVGKLSLLSIEGPTPDTEQLYVKSLNVSTEQLRRQIARLMQPPLPDGTPTGVHVRQSDLPNRDLDTGAKARPGTYRLMDETYANLLRRVTEHPELGVPYGLQQDVLEYYSDPKAPISTKKKPKKWAQVQSELAVLALMRVTPDI